MAIAWKLGKFIDGSITREDALPVKDAGSSISVDINGEDTTELAIAKSGLTSYEANNWQEVFQPITTILIAVDTEKEWDDPFVVPFVGFVNKITDQIQDGIINVQLTSLSEYTKARIVADSWANVVTDPTTEITFSGDTWTSVIIDIVTSCFSQEGIPAGKPKPPTVIGNMPAYTDGAIKKSVRVADAKTYYDVLQEVKNDNSGTGLEYRFKPRFRNAGMTDIAWDLIVGTNQNPHIGEDITIELELADNDAKFSKFSATIDSNSVFSKMYIQSKAGDEETKEGADFTQASVDSSKFPILVERFFNPGVELTDAEIQAQLTSRLKYSIENSFETSFTLEEKNDISQWLGRLGSIITVTGVDDTISAGHSAEVRCVGLTFTPGTGTISVDVMQIQPSYPRLPKDRVKDLLNGGNQGNSSPIAPIAPIGGGGTPSIPSVPSMPKPPSGGADGIFSPDQSWGDQPHLPWQEFPPPVVQTLGFRNYMDTSQIIENWDGIIPIDPWSACTGVANRIYGIDRISMSWQTAYYSDGETIREEFIGDGLVDVSSGEPAVEVPDVYVKKTYMIDGELGPLETVGVIPAKIIKRSFASWDPKAANMSKKETTFSKSVGISNFILNDRFYAVIGSQNIIRSETSDYNNSFTYHYINAHALMVSCEIDLESGKLTGEWEDHGKWKNDIHAFPMTPFINKSGNNLYFTQTAHLNTTDLIKTVVSDAGKELYVGSELYSDYIKNNPGLDMNYRGGPFGAVLATGEAFSGGRVTMAINSNGGLIQRIAKIGIDFANPYIRGLWNVYGGGQGNTPSEPTPGFRYPYWSQKGVIEGDRLYSSLNMAGLASFVGSIKLLSGGSMPEGEQWKSSIQYDLIEGGSTNINLCTIGGKIVAIGSAPFKVYYNTLKAPSTSTAKAIPDDQTYEYNNFAFNVSESDSPNWPLAENSFVPPNSNVTLPKQYVAKRIITFDNRLYLFALEMNDEGTARNKLVCHSMEAYDPSI